MTWYRCFLQTVLKSADTRMTCYRFILVQSILKLVFFVLYMSLKDPLVLYALSSDYKDVYADGYTLCGKNSISLFIGYCIQSIVNTK